jgi:hypothetical protein
VRIVYYAVMFLFVSRSSTYYHCHLLPGLVCGKTHIQKYFYNKSQFFIGYCHRISLRGYVASNEMWGGSGMVNKDMSVNCFKVLP